MYSKQEIEQAKEDLIFFNEGEYITKEMAHSARVLEQYIEDLEKEKEEAYWNGWVHRQAQDGEICKMCKYRKQYIEQRNKKGEEK